MKEAPEPESTKVAAIMSTSMVGPGSQTELVELALREEHARLVRELLPRHGGREVKMVEDGFLLEFERGLPAVRFGHGAASRPWPSATGWLPPERRAGAAHGRPPGPGDAPGRRRVRRGREPGGAHRVAGPARHPLCQRAGGARGGRPSAAPRRAAGALGAEEDPAASGGVPRRAARQDTRARRSSPRVRSLFTPLRSGG